MDDSLSRIIDAGAGGAVGGAAIGALVAVVATFFWGIKKFGLKDVKYRRKIVGITALATALGMSLFPPWRLEHKGRSIDRGYALLFDPPHPPA